MHARDKNVLDIYKEKITWTLKLEHKNNITMNWIYKLKVLRFENDISC